MILENLTKPFDAKQKYFYTKIYKLVPHKWNKLNDLLTCADPKSKKRVILMGITTNREELDYLVDMYIETYSNKEKVYNYLSKLLNNLKHVSEFKEAIPSYYHQYVTLRSLTGNKSLKELYSAECYSLMEEVILSNLLLGVTSDNC